MEWSDFTRALLSGAAAGFSVDVALYPIDTVKTRIQSKEGFFKSGGFRGIYRGLLAASIGSAPSAALFFSTYDTAKRVLKEQGKMGDNNSTAHMIAASLGEVAACLCRVPTDNIKQKQQAGISNSLAGTVSSIRASQGFRGFYRGYMTTCARDVPFALIQFPLWEWMKLQLAKREGVEKCSPVKSALCGSVAGAVAAGLTTPLDVAKTRQMLDLKGETRGLMNVLHTVWKKEGISSLFSGVQPRVLWISIGGFVFFGAYEKAYSLLPHRKENK